MAEGSGELKPLDVAAILVCGEMAERMLWGQPEVFNWLHDDHDASYARSFTDERSDPFAARKWVELRSRMLLHNRWKALEAIADELTRKRYIDGATVDRLARANGAKTAAELLRKAAEKRRKVDPDRHMVKLSNGTQISVRRWADAVAAAGHDPKRAEQLLIGGKEEK
jgi:hypothetical protein